MIENGMTRRQALTGVAWSSAALVGAAVSSACRRARATESAVAPATGAPASAHNGVSRALQGGHSMTPLSFDPRALRGLSEQLITSHHENNYGGAVRNLNRVEQELSQVTAETPPFVVAALREKELTFRNSKSLHEAYFGNLGGDGQLTPTIQSALVDTYGSLGAWEQHFRATALGLGGGSGWVVLGLELDTGALRTTAASSHQQSLGTSVPLLVLDMYEHSYHLDFGAEHGRYIEAFVANVQWGEVERRLQNGRRAVEALQGA